MNRLLHLKEMPKDELEAIKIYYKRMGRDTLWKILGLLNKADDWLTKEQISEKIKRKNIGTDLRFLTFINIIDRKYIDIDNDHTYMYAISYDAAMKYANKIPSKYTILECDLSDSEKRKDFIKKFTPKKRKTTSRTQKKE